MSEQDVYSEIEEADILREKIELAISEIEDGLSGSRHDVSRSERGATRLSVIVAVQMNPSQNVTAVVDDIETPSYTSSSTLTVPVVAIPGLQTAQIRAETVQRRTA